MSEARIPRAGAAEPETAPAAAAATPAKPKPVEEIGGPDGPDPTRFGDWSVKGRCIDF